MTTKNFGFVLASLLVLSLVLCGCSGQGEKPKTDTPTTEIEQMMKDLDAAWASHDIERILAFYSDDCIYEDVVFGKVNHGKEELRAFIKEAFTGFPDFRVEGKSFFTSGNRICSEWIMSGTHSGNLPGMPATGKSFSVPGVSVSELKDGKVKQNTDYYDGASLMRQLGLLPPAMSADPFVGTWKMNPAKSKFSYPAPKSYTITFSAQDNGIKAVEDIVDADGKATHRSFYAKYDGKDYPVTAPDQDTISVKNPDVNTADYVGKKNGKEVWSGRSVVSKDGKAFTNNGGGKGSNGQAFTYSLFFEKQ
jgi:steroid delta-isomerase-like uncharacterized protein